VAAEPIDPGVPIREGEYGDRVVSIEPGGVEYIADAERHGRPAQLFWTWTSPNFEFATVYVGVLPIVTFGGAFWPTVLGLLLGTALGSVTHGLLSTFGPRFGVAQLIQSRGAFGFIGNLLPAFLNAVTSGAG
jgi:NCS1 family nucleobase:cation symporter-1